MGGIAKVFSSVFTGSRKKIKKPMQQVSKIAQKGQQQASAVSRLGYGTTSSMLGGASNLTEQAPTSRTLLGS